MREKINSDPKFQLIFVVGLLAVAGLLFVTRMGGGGEETTAAAPAPADPAAAPATTDPAAVPTDPAAVPTAIDPATGAVAPAAGAPSGALPSVPAPPLPADVQAAVDTGQPFALFVYRTGAIEDKRVGESVRRQSAVQSVELFEVPVADVARYTAVTQGVNLDRTPALIIVKPGAAGAAPTGSVTYAFQSPAAIEQIFRDAGYDGPKATYQPS